MAVAERNQHRFSIGLRDLQNIARAIVQHRGNPAKLAALRGFGAQADDIGVILFSGAGSRQRLARNVQPRALQRLRRAASVYAGETHDQFIRAVMA